MEQGESRPTRRSPPTGTRTARRGRIVQLLLLFVAAVIIVDGLVGDRGLLAMLRKRHEYGALAATIARQRAENARLREEVQRLHDPAAIEEIARRQLGFIRRGEKVFIIRDVVSPSTSQRR